MLKAGQILQTRYVIQRMLGQGGMGRVYLALDKNLNDQRCVVKELDIGIGAGLDLADVVDQFQQEAFALSKMSHPLLPRVTNSFQEGANYYLVMDYVEGQTLESIIGMGLPEPQVLKYADDLLDTLAYVHAQGLLHRDIKPQNIIIRASDHRPVLVDFGLVKPVSTGTVAFIKAMGTPEYAPPEQISGGTAPESDVYSLGATMYHAITGAAPIAAGDRISGVMMPGVSTLRPGVSQSVAAAIDKSVELERSRRHPSAAMFRQALRQAQPAATKRVATAPMSPMVQPKQRTTLLAVAVGVVLTATCAGLAAFAATWMRASATPAASAAATPPSATQDLPISSPAPPTAPLPSEAASSKAVEDAVRATTDAIAARQTAEAPVNTIAAPAATLTAAPVVATSQVATAKPRNVGSVVNDSYEIGRSARGTQLAAYEIGADGADTAVVIVGRIAGEQGETSSLVNDLRGAYGSNPSIVPDGVRLYLIPDISPDREGVNSRLNGNRVDINRNWDTPDWTANPPIAGIVVRGAGGSSPFSEPESRALRDLVLSLKNDFARVRVIVLHTSSKPGRRQIFPGYLNDSQIHQASADYAQDAGSILGYSYETGGEPTSGEAIAWFAKVDVPSIDLFWSASGPDRPSLDEMTRVIETLSR